MCHRRITADRRADSDFHISFYGSLLSEKIYPICQAAVNLMSGVPSVVYGFFGLVLIVPLMNAMTGKDGSTMLTASILLAIMILPTIIGVSETAIRSVPEHYYEGSLALGATKERSLFSVVLPAARSGVIAGIVLGIGRAIGETMAVIMIAGNQPRMPKGLFQGRSNHDSQYRAGNGLCNGSAPGGADRYRRCAVCLYFNHQSGSFIAEQEGEP